MEGDAAARACADRVCLVGIGVDDFLAAVERTGDLSDLDAPEGERRP
jgi:hypothetical protein